MTMEKVSELSSGDIKDLKRIRAEWESSPIIITFFTPVTIAYEALSAPTFGIFFISHIIYFFHPLPLPILNELPWDYSISIIAAII